MNDGTMKLSSGQIRVDSDGMLAYHYVKDGRNFRKSLFRISGGVILIKDPGSGEQVAIGYVLEAEGLKLFIFH